MHMYYTECLKHRALLSKLPLHEPDESRYNLDITCCTIYGDDIYTILVPNTARLVLLEYLKKHESDMF